ncbi:recombinase family protein [Azotobacter chroococcum]|uniref:Resolvase domain-containing protein n=1 Tax=Azotobacter chroococcum NCIMB 8003 TaxID=1328314 RepID=A0A0C4WW40_9GAMM|nr:recombinase family protein [Azotobacter chroococcum]AJE23107.1 Resolvase domain-containing protein [Azotobacter chroococcum NCIMB 8003]
MFIRAYLRASTDQQDASRAKQSLIDFAQERGHRIASFYVENESGASLQRPELFRLLDDAHEGDVLLIEQVDRLSRLSEPDWQKLRVLIASKGVVVVALDLPTSWAAFSASSADPFTGRMLSAINSMLLDMLAAVARKDYDDRRRRQAQGIAKAKEAGAYKGRKQDEALRAKITELLNDGKSIRKVAELLECSTTTVQRVKASLSEPL